MRALLLSLLAIALPAFGQVCAPSIPRGSDVEPTFTIHYRAGGSPICTDPLDQNVACMKKCVADGFGSGSVDVPAGTGLTCSDFQSGTCHCGAPPHEGLYSIYPPKRCNVCAPFWELTTDVGACAQRCRPPCPDRYTATGLNYATCQGPSVPIKDDFAADEGATLLRDAGDSSITSYTDSRGQNWQVTSFDVQRRPTSWINPDGTTTTVVYYPDSNVIWSREEAGGPKVFPNLPIGIRGAVTPGIRGERVKSDGVALEDGVWKQAAAAGSMTLVRAAPGAPQVTMLIASGVSGAQAGNLIYGLIEPVLSMGIDGLCAVPVDSGLDAETPHDREMRCNAQYDRDENVCGVYLSNNYTKPGGTPYPAHVVNWNLHRYTVCKASAIRRLGQCLGGSAVEELELIHQGAPNP